MMFKTPTTRIILARIPSSKGTKFVGNVLKKILHQVALDMKFTYYLGVIRKWMVNIGNIAKPSSFRTERELAMITDSLSQHRRWKWKQNKR